MRNGMDDRNERLYNGIENVLAHMHKKIPADAQMAEIRRRFPEPVFFLEANTYTLKRMGLPRLDAFYFALIPNLARRAKREAFGKKPRLNTLSRMSEYLKTLFIGEHVECSYAMLLDARGYLIDTMFVRRGNISSAPFNLKEVLSAVVQKDAKAIVMCHNHPCGTLHPSEGDIACTLLAMNALATMGVPLLDHVIIANHRAVSIRDVSATPPAGTWLMQAPDNKLLRDWLDVDLLV